jgi:CheY-like chemotaxis protein
MVKLRSLLVVDDSIPCIEFISLAVEAVGGVVVSSETQSPRALERVRAERPDLLLLDVKMPDLDGFSVLRLLRGEGNTVPVVMLSGSARQNDVDRAYALGCNGYLQKPTSIDGYRALAAALVAYWRRGELPVPRGAAGLV